jgi:hypothetical protein
MVDDPEEPSPGMIGEPPSARGLPAIPADPAEHAVRSAREWQDVAETYARRRMRALGIPKDRIGSNDHKHGLSQAAFNPYEGIGGSVGTIGEINLDSGVLNPDLMRKYGTEAGEAWEHASLKTRYDTTIAHEYEEGNGSTHDEAIRRAQDTELPISHAARELARKIRDGLTR